MAEKEEIKTKNELARLSIAKKVELKKKLNEIRKQIKGYLDAKSDPMRGEIMRCVDESMIYHFIEKYDGMSMSAEAILVLIGNAIGSAILTPDLHGAGEFSMSESAAMHQPSSSSGSPSLLQSHPSAPSGLVASQSMEMSHNSMINNYKSFGRRSPSPKPAMSGFDDLMNRASINFSEDQQDHSLTLDDHFRLTRQQDPVQGIQPRRYDQRSVSPFNAHRPLSATVHGSPEKTMASGFRVPSRPSSHDPTAMTSERVKTPKTPSMVVMSSQHLRRVAEEMGFDLTRPVTADDVLKEEAVRSEGLPRPHHHHHPGESPHRERSECEGERKVIGEDEDVRNRKLSEEAIAVMHEQLLEEELLPALRPEVVLSPDQLSALGEKRRTWDDIFREVSRQGPRPGHPDTIPDDTSSLGDESIVHHGSTGANAAESSSARKKSAGRKGRSSQGIRLHPPAAPKLGEAASHASSRSSLIEALLESEQHFAGRPPLQVAIPDGHDDGVLVYPSSPTHHASSPSKPLPFFGSLAQRREDQQRLHALAESERRRAEERLILPALRPPEMRGGADIPPNRLLTMNPEEFVALNAPLMAKGPRALKSRGGAVGNDAPAKSPFDSWADEMAVLTRGIPAGAGLRLYRSHSEVTPEGRYRSKHRSRTHEGTKSKPFVSAI